MCTQPFLEGLSEAEQNFVLDFFTMSNHKDIKDYNQAKNAMFEEGFRLGVDKRLSSAVVAYLRYQDNEMFSMYVTYQEAFYEIVEESSGPISDNLDDAQKEKAWETRFKNHMNLKVYREEIRRLKTELFADPADTTTDSDQIRKRGKISAEKNAGNNTH